MIKVALVGGSGGIGAALLSKLSERSDVESIQGTYFRSSTVGSLGSSGQSGSGIDVTWSQVDVTCESSVEQWISKIGEVDWLINCAGFLHDSTSEPEKTIAQFDPEYFKKNMQVNCLPNLILAKYVAKY